LRIVDCGLTDRRLRTADYIGDCPFRRRAAFSSAFWRSASASRCWAVLCERTKMAVSSSAS